MLLDDYQPPASPPPDADAPPMFRVVGLGVRGAGKSVLLATMFHELNYSTPQRSYYLDTDGETRIALGDIYAEVSDTSRDWPPGTPTANTREFVFDCFANDHRSKDPVLRVCYLDYGGELLERAQESGSTAQSTLLGHIDRADAMLGMIDGHRVLQLLRGEPAGHEYFQHTLRPMLGFMHHAACPIHLVITKWDLVRDFGEPHDADDQLRLERVIDALLRYEHIKALTHTLGDGGQKVVRLIPVSAVVPDLFSQVERELDEKSRRRLQRAMRAYLRSEMGSVLAHMLRRPAIAAATVLIPGYGGAAAVLFLEWLAPRPDQTRDPRKAIETEMATRQQVLDDFKRSVLRLEAALPQSALSGRW
jgi:hypothetical protein